MSHQVGGMLDLPHGMCNAVLLPHVVRFNAEAYPDRFRPLADAMAVPDAATRPADELGPALADRIAALATSIGAPRTLGEIGVTEDDLPGFARHALDDACLTTNPRDVRETDVLAILKAAF
jgi:alcohol dehydrogenase class IV